jgi:hypothetical protein
MAVRPGKMHHDPFLRPWGVGFDRPRRHVREPGPRRQTFTGGPGDDRPCAILAKLPRGSRRILRRNRRFFSNPCESSQISGRPKRGFRILHVFEFRNDLSRENVWLDRAAIVD